MSRHSTIALLALISSLSLSGLTKAQKSHSSSWPHEYPGMPTGGYGPQWQHYFQVTESLPNVTWPLRRNWAGNIPVQRPDHPNDTLFFWALESSDGSFTAPCSDEPWAIWLNGGPGASSLLGLLLENGPIRISSDYSASENKYSWTNVVDYVWVDQPVGTGFSTADANGYVRDEDQIGTDFMGFLENFIKVFPDLATRPLYITGESYAGTYIPYIAKTYFGMESPPVKLAGLAIGDGVIGSTEESEELPVITVLETYPQIIGYDTKVFEYFREQSRLCGYNLTLQYPQPEHFPTLNAPFSSSASSGRFSRQQWLSVSLKSLLKRDVSLPDREERVRARDLWKRDLTGRANGTLDPWYLCDLYSEVIDYAINFTFPWSLGPDFDQYDIPDALSPKINMDASIFLNDDRTRAAIHAPTSKNWTEFIGATFASTNETTNFWGDPSPEPMTFLTDLATNATKHDVKIALYSGNDDYRVPHFGTQVVIQNTSFGGIQGFTRKPETPWYNDAGEFAGIVHQERGWTYVLVDHVGHFVPRDNPISALTLAREFIFGHNKTGLVVSTKSGGVTVVGGERMSLGGEVMTGQAAIYYGSATTASSYIFPSATVEAWGDYIATATPAV